MLHLDPSNCGSWASPTPVAYSYPRRRCEYSMVGAQFQGSRVAFKQGKWLRLNQHCEPEPVRAGHRPDAAGRAALQRHGAPRQRQHLRECLRVRMDPGKSDPQWGLPISLGHLPQMPPRCAAFCCACPGGVAETAPLARSFPFEDRRAQTTTALHLRRRLHRPGSLWQTGASPHRPPPSNAAGPPNTRCCASRA
jgi:hypothetical protein